MFMCAMYRSTFLTYEYVWHTNVYLCNVQINIFDIRICVTYECLSVQCTDQHSWHTNVCDLRMFICAISLLCGSPAQCTCAKVIWVNIYVSLSDYTSLLKKCTCAMYLCNKTPRAILAVWENIGGLAPAPPMLSECNTLFGGAGANPPIFSEYVSLLSQYVSLLSEYTSLLIQYTSVLSEYTSLLSGNMFGGAGANPPVLWACFQSKETYIHSTQLYIYLKETYSHSKTHIYSLK